MKPLQDFFRSLWSDAEKIPTLKLEVISSYEEWRSHVAISQRRMLEISRLELQLVPSHHGAFDLVGFCYVCKKHVRFYVDFEYSYEVNGVLTPNWREKLACPNCRLNNRMRAAVQIFEQEFKPRVASRIYIAEQTTPLHDWLYRNYPGTIGSEYIGQSVPFGRTDAKGIRNESLTKLSFEAGHFDFILSFDVFEHIPDYKKALSECYRCLAQGGTLCFTVPFLKNSESHLVRASMDGKGRIHHLLPPEYHGDPLNKDGCLCFQTFGWQLVDELKEVGFTNVSALLYWSRDLGYLGGEQIVFKAQKR